MTGNRSDSPGIPVLVIGYGISVPAPATASGWRDSGKIPASASPFPAPGYLPRNSSAYPEAMIFAMMGVFSVYWIVRKSSGRVREV